MEEKSKNQPRTRTASRPNLMLWKRPSGPKIDTIIVSDIHLGSKVSRVEKLTDIIEKEYHKDGQYLFNRLVLLGDIFDNHDAGRLADEHWDFLSLIKKLSHPKSGVEVVWLEGNHDPASHGVAGHLAEAEVAKDYEWEYAGRKFIATHGDRFDTFIDKHKGIANFFTDIYESIQQMDIGKRRVSRLLKRISKIIYLPKNFHLDILAFARAKRVDAVFCGHTHHAEKRVSPDGIVYCNTGCWTDYPSTYATVGEEGIQVREVW